MNKYGIRINLGIRASAEEKPETVRAQVEAVVEHLLDLESNGLGLLDSTVGLNLADISVTAATYVASALAGTARAGLATAVSAAGEARMRSYAVIASKSPTTS